MQRPLLVVLAALLAGFAACQPSDQGGRALWLMNETSGPTVVDSAGGHDGTASNVAFGQPGQENRAYGFNGVNSIVRVPHAEDLNPGSRNFSFGAWVNFTQLPPPQTWDVIRKGVSDTSGGYYKLELFTGNGGARARCYFRDGSGASKSVVRGAGLNDGRWHQLTCRRQGNGFQITVDGGTSSNTASLASIGNRDELTIGAKPTGGDAYNGRLDEVAFSLE